MTESKIALLSCDDLSAFVVDDDLLINAYRKKYPEDQIDFVSWSDENVNWDDYDLTVIRTTWDYIKRLPDFLRVLAKIEKESSCKLFNSYETVLWNSKKTYLAGLADKGVGIIPSLYLGEMSESTFYAEVEKIDTEKFILKPVVGAGSDSLRVLEKKDLSSLYNELPRVKDWFLQPFLNEVFEGELSFIYFKDHLSHAIRKVPKDGDFRVQEEFGGDILSYEPTPEDLQFCNHVLNQINEDLLYARVDAVRVNGSLHLMELELIEPSLYFRTSEGSAEAFADVIKSIT